MVIKKRYESPFVRNLNNRELGEFNEIFKDQIKTLLYSFKYAMQHGHDFITFTQSKNEDIDKWKRGTYADNTFQVVSEIDSWDYASEDETCPDTICENPRFKIVENINADWQDVELNDGSGNLLKVDLLQQYAKAFELDSVAKSIADKINSEEVSSEEGFNEYREHLKERQNLIGGF